MTFSFFDAPTFPARDATTDVGVNKELRRSPSIEVVTEPSVQAEDVGKKTADQIFDTFTDAGKQKSLAAKKASGSAAGGGGFEKPSIQPSESELELYYHTYTEDQSVNYHRPPWSVMQGDDISNNPSACRDILSGLGTPFEVLQARSLPRGNRINQLFSMFVGSSIMVNSIMEDYKILSRKEKETAQLRAEAGAMAKAARDGAEQLEKEKTAFEQYKQTEAWAATAGLKQVRTLAKLLSDECKGWREACARENEKIYRVRQEVANLKAANAALMKEKAAAEAVAREAKEAEARAAKALEEVNAGRNHLNKVAEDLKVWVAFTLEFVFFA
ncbi:hypothetical protein Hanom_Chr02g00119581 [Helianthus anomalus]